LADSKHNAYSINRKEILKRRKKAMEDYNVFLIENGEKPMSAMIREGALRP